MSNVYPIQPSFAAGELSPTLWGRPDLAKYGVGLRRCENFIIHPHGGVSKRQGLMYIARTKSASGAVRLVPFQFNISDAYVLEFGNNYIRVFREGQQVMSGGVPYEIPTPYLESELNGLAFTQSADVLFIVHSNHAPRELTRSSDDNWTLSLFAFKNGPFIAKGDNQTKIKIQPSGTSGNITLTVTDPLIATLFVAGHVGSVWCLSANVEEENFKLSAPTTDASVTIINRYSATNYDNTGITVFGTHKSWTEVLANLDSYVTMGAIWLDTNGPIAIWSVSSVQYMGLYSSVPHVAPVIKVYKGWQFETGGFWRGTVYLQRRDENGNWKKVKSYYSASNTSAGKNFIDTGEVDEPTDFRVIISSDWVNTPPEGNDPTDAGYVNFTRSEAAHDGFVKIKSVESPVSASASVITELASSEATVLWKEGAWSDYRGWPSAIGFYQQRLFLANTKSEPQTFWASKSGDYNNFGVSYPVVDDDALSGTLVSDKVSELRYFIQLNALISMSSECEWIIGPGNKEVITPSSFVIKAQGYRGSSYLKPVMAGSTILFVQTQGCRVRSLGYDFASDTFTGNDLTILANHLFEQQGIKSWAWQQEPDSMVWCVRDDGSVCTLTYLEEHDVIAWARHPMSGEVECVCSVQSQDGDDVYFVVKRNGVRTVERFMSIPVTTAENGIYLDGCVHLNSTTDVSVVSGLSHLEGMTVTALVDGNVEEGHIVSAGKITLRTAGKVVRVGVPYSSELETLDLSLQRQDGTQLGRKARVSQLTVRVRDTRGLFAGSPNGTMEEFKDRSGEDYDTAISLLNGDLVYTLDSTYDEARVVLSAPLPLPCSVLAIMPRVSVTQSLS